MGSCSSAANAIPLGEQLDPKSADDNTSDDKSSVNAVSESVQSSIKRRDSQNRERRYSKRLSEDNSLATHSELNTKALGNRFYSGPLLSNEAIITLPGDQKEYKLKDAEIDLRERQEVDAMKQKHVQDERRKRAEEEVKKKETRDVETAVLEERVRRICDHYRGNSLSVEAINRWYSEVMASKGLTGRVTKPLVKDDRGRKKLAKLREERSKLQHRFCEIASRQLRANNPHIVDLSDPNRGNKLAERLSELYDNQWTDLFEDITRNKKVKDRRVIELLRDVLKFCYEHCQRLAVEQRVKLRQQLSMSSANNNVGEEDNTVLRLKLKEFQKSTTSTSLPNIQQDVKQAIVASRSLNIRSISSLDITSKANQNSVIVKYMNCCTDISWHMQLQDPALVLLFYPADEEEGVAQFRPYTSLGSVIKYVLWPAMLLHNGGAMLSRGVAQFQR